MATIDAPGLDLSAGGGHNPVAADLGRPGALVDPRPIGIERPGDSLEVLDRVELRLVVEADRGGDFEREVGPLGERRRQPGCERRLHLGLDLPASLGILGVREVRFAPQVAVDPELRGERLDASDPPLVRLAIGASGLGAVGGGDRVVGEPVQGAQLRGGVAAHAGPDLAALEHDHVGAVALQLQRGREAGDPGPDHRHVDAEVGRQRRPRSSLRSIAPERDRAPGQSLNPRGHRHAFLLPGWLSVNRRAQASSRFSTLPVALRGSESRNSTSRGTL